MVLTVFELKKRIRNQESVTQRRVRIWVRVRHCVDHVTSKRCFGVDIYDDWTKGDNQSSFNCNSLNSILLVNFG